MIQYLAWRGCHNLCINKMKLSNADRHLITFLSTARSQQITSILFTLTLQQQKSLIEIVYNILKGTISLTNATRKKIIRHQKDIRSLVVGQLTERQRRNRLQKIVSIIPLLMTAFIKYESGNDLVD